MTPTRSTLENLTIAIEIIVAEIASECEKGRVHRIRNLAINLKELRETRLFLEQGK
jgi:hypothetical protein